MSDVNVMEPGAEVDAKAAKVEKVLWGERDADGQLITKLTWGPDGQMPEGFNNRKHKGLTPKDFASRADFLEFRAARLESQAKDAREEAIAERSGKGATTKAKQRKLLKLKDSYEALLAELAKDGTDVNELLGSVE